jgi:hypothetical protein
MNGESKTFKKSSKKKQSSASYTEDKLFVTMFTYLALMYYIQLHVEKPTNIEYWYSSLYPHYHHPKNRKTMNE